MLQTPPNCFSPCFSRIKPAATVLIGKDQSRGIELLRNSAFTYHCYEPSLPLKHNEI